MSRRRHLTDEERALWTGFARSIKPLDHAQEPPALETAAAEPVASKPAAAKPAAAKSAATKPAARNDLPRAEKSPPLAPLGRRLRRRVARGREPIDDRIDLHGHTQTKAHAALLRFLRGAQARWRQGGARRHRQGNGKRRPRCGSRARRSQAASADVARPGGISPLRPRIRGRAYRSWRGRGALRAVASRPVKPALNLTIGTRSHREQEKVISVCEKAFSIAV